MASVIVVAPDFVLENVSVLDSTVELVIDEGDAGGDLHDSRARVSLVAIDDILIFERPCWPTAGFSRACPMVRGPSESRYLAILKLLILVELCNKPEVSEHQR